MLSLNNISKYCTDDRGQQVSILAKIDLEVQTGELVAIFGPNGCGKSTLMNIISGLDRPSNGEIIWNKANPQISYLFQDYKSSLLPWQTAYQNIALPLHWQGLNKTQTRDRIANLVDKFRIDINLNAYPFTLSGGQAQLVSILRSIAVEPDLLILDEPFSALDYLNSIELLLKLQEIWLKSGFTGIFISHNIEEAIFLGDRLVILSPKPTKILDIIEIDLPRPRSIDILTDPQFIRIKQQALATMQLLLQTTLDLQD